jgi:hypothetical protein
VYVGAADAPTVWQFDGSAAGLVAKTPATVAADTAFAIALTPDGKQAYVVHSPEGRKVGTRCVKPTKANRSRRACTRRLRAPSTRVDGGAGATSLRLVARTLKPGR